MSRIGVLGAGTIGMSMAKMLKVAGHEVTVWSAIPEEIEECVKTKRHHNLPGMVIPEGITFTTDISEVCHDKDVIMAAIPSVFIRSTMKTARDYIKDGQLIADVGKGIEIGTHYTMSQIIEDELKKDNKHDNIRVVALSGPTHAEEIALDMPTTIVSACEDLNAAREVQKIFMNSCMRVYTNADIIGVEICGALKNVIALACGIATGIGCGDNAKAALITRGIAEITRMGLRMGCMEQTFSGLAGIGDLIVTATSMHSRNNRCGMLIGEGKSVDEAVKEVGQVVEGLNALPAAVELAKQYDVDMPIVMTLDKVVKGELDPVTAVEMLMSRPAKDEVSKEAHDKFFEDKKKMNKNVKTK